MKAVCFSNFKLVSRCLYFGNGSLIVRSSCIVPISFVKGKWGEKKILLISKFAN